MQHTAPVFDDDGTNVYSSAFDSQKLEMRGGQAVEEMPIKSDSDACHPTEEHTARTSLVARSQERKIVRDDEPPSTSPSHRRYTVGNQLKATIFRSWINVLLLAVPAGFVVNYLNLSPIAVFFVNFAAILPINSIFTLAIDEMKLRTGALLGVLIYMSLG